jgi:hypothetical protein
MSQENINFLKEMRSISKSLKENWCIVKLELLDKMIEDWINELEGIDDK